MSTMAKPQIIIQGLGLQAIKRAVYAARNGQPLGQRDIEYPEQEVEVTNRLDTGSDDAQVTSYLGTPVFSDLTLKATEEDDGLNVQTVLFDVGQRKNIITTTVPGRSGTVKEYISDGDYDVQIAGLLVSEDMYSYPTDQVKTLRRLLQTNTELIAVSPFLQLFNIYNLVVLDYRIPQERGYQNHQPFNINCISDTPIELIEDA